MNEWHGKRVVIVGIARQGTALARFLVEAGAHVILNDQRPIEEFEQIRQSLADLNPDSLEWVCGGHFMEVLDRVDAICPSGGVPLTIPLIQEARRRNIPLTNDSQIFLERAPCPVIGITGSAGKTTTTSLVGRIAEHACTNATMATQHPYRYTWVGGNIGSPLIANLGQIQPADLVVMELSSFQLELMTCSPQVAAVLNITPNHLDRHATMEAYRQAKQRILDYQENQDIAVIGRDNPGSWSLAEKARGRVMSFGLQPLVSGYAGTFTTEHELYYTDGSRAERLMSRASISLRGEHNLMNVLAACAICLAAGLPLAALQAGVESFMGVPHRLEFVRRWGGADWYNDSIATAPERAIAAVQSFNETIVLLAGGRDKNLPWDEFAEMVRKRVDHLIVFGEAASKITNAVGNLSKHNRPYSLTVCSGLQQAVQAAAQVIEPGDVVLLAPGGTSFDEFRDFEARGEAFRKWVCELA
jgi:UDP-N-acetylmuramoylalanine--D-glutamate ligase